MNNNQLIEYPFEEGGSIFVEIRSINENGFERTSNTDNIVKANQTFEKAIDSIKPMSQKIINKIRELVNPPDEVQVEFSVKLGVKAGVILASADSEANFKIQLTWKNNLKNEISNINETST